MAYQQIIIQGNVGRDSELSYTPQGIAVAKFTVAVSKVIGRGDTKQEKTIWFKVSIWREKAENLSQYIKKGDPIMIVGEIDVEVYTNKDGQPAASFVVTGRDVVLMGSKGSGDRQRDSSADPF